jgi:CPA1 family monovalent cation:H+ antiporter
VRLSVSLHIAILPILAIVAVVIIARAVSIYISVAISNQIKSEGNIPSNWQHLLSWGSLRGSIAVIMVLLIPDDLTLDKWTYDFSIKDFIIAITVASIYFSLLIKATTIGAVIRFLKIDTLRPYEKLGYYKSKALVYHDLMTRIEGFHKAHNISEPQYKAFTENYKARYQQVKAQFQKEEIDDSRTVENILRLYTLGIQKRELKRMFQYDEINEVIYKKNLSILETQTERVEQDSRGLSSLNNYVSSKTSLAIKKICRQLPQPEEQYLYYRAQYSLINKVLDEMDKLKQSSLMEIFDDSHAFDNVLTIYKYLKTRAKEQMQKELQKNQGLVDYINQQSAEIFLHTAQHDTLKELHSHKIITRKLYVLLRKELGD